MIRISELLLMLTGEGEKLSKSEVRVKLTVAGSVYQSSQVRIHNRSAEWNSNALPMIEIASSCESFPLKMEVILDQGYVLGSGSSEIISGRNTQGNPSHLRQTAWILLTARIIICMGNSSIRLIGCTWLSQSFLSIAIKNQNGR